MWRQGQRPESCSHKPRNPGATRGCKRQGGIPLKSIRRECGPVNTLVSGSWLPKLWADKTLLLSAVQFMVICHSSPKKIIWPQPWEKKSKHFLYSFFMGTFINLPSGESSRTQSVKEIACPLPLCFLCGPGPQLSPHLGDFTQKGTPQFSPTRHSVHNPTSSYLGSDPSRRHRWAAGYVILVFIQFERKYDCPIYTVQKIMTDHKGRCFKNLLGEFLQEPETQDLPCGLLRGRDRCPSPSPPTFSLLGLAFLSIYFFLCIF